MLVRIFIAALLKLENTKQNVVLEGENNRTRDDHYDSKVCVSMHINANMHSDASFSRLNTKMLFKRSPLLQQSNENK